MDPGSKLRHGFDSPSITHVASIQDGLTGKLAEAAGFPAAVLGGATVTNSLLGMPDAGFITLTEMEFVTARAVAACGLPILVDTDSGYGNAINVVRTTRTLERAGAAGMFFEDQENPPRGASSGLALVSPDEMAGKVAAAADSKDNDSFVVIARSDARSVEGLEATIERGRQYVEAGADGFFAAGVMTPDELTQVAKEVPARYHIGVLGGPKTGPRPDELQGLGYSCVVSGMSPVRAGALTTLRLFEQIRETGISADADFLDGSALEDWEQFTGFEWMKELEERFLPSDILDRRYAERGE